MAGFPRRLLVTLMTAVVLSILPLSSNGFQAAYASGSRCPAGYKEAAYDANNHSSIGVSAHIDIYACNPIVGGQQQKSTDQYIISIWGSFLQDRVFGWRIWRCGQFYGSGNARLISGSEIRYEERYIDKQDVRTIIRPRKDWNTPMMATTTGDIGGNSDCDPGSDTDASSVTQGDVQLFMSIPNGVFYANVVHQGS